jgi:tryptophan synthase alpha chain
VRSDKKGSVSRLVSRHSSPITSSRIADAFRRAASENRAAFIAYLTAGDPRPDATVAMAAALERAGADVLELGVPFSDPIADGPVLQRAAARALAGGTRLETVFEIARRIRSQTRLALVLFTYLNPLLRRGRGVAAEAREAGFDGVLVTDLPPDEALEYQPLFRREGLDTIFLVSPTSTPARMKAAARLSSGFLYVVSRPGTTGTRESLPRDLAKTVGRSRRAADHLPVAIGFGISTPETACQAAGLADGVVVGSALVRAAEEAGDGFERALERFARPLVVSCRRDKDLKP